MKEITVKLKQHTPLLHFQPMQESAFLRASEVKPKLDRFLINKWKRDHNTEWENSNNKWLVGKGEHPALNYKMSFEYKGKTDVSLETTQKTKLINNRNTIVHETETFPNILSNMGGKEKKSELANLVMYSDITMYIRIFADENTENKMSEAIIEELPRFFANTNFGQRSSKGFGSFSVSKIGDKDINFESSLLPSTTPFFRYEYNNNNENSIRKLFEVIDFYWKCLKSGVNYTRRDNIKGTRRKPNAYIKSFLYIYLNELSGQNMYTWEKKEIKQTLNLCSDPLSTDTFIKNNDENPRKATFARALLGSPTNSITYRIFQNKKQTTQEVDIKITNEDIERIASPIIFKPIVEAKRTSVYILFNEELISKLRSYDNIGFKISLKNDKNKNLKINAIPSAIDYPTLISKYHASFHNKEERFKRVFNTSLTRAEYEKQKNMPEGSYRYKFIARDFNWENILGKNQGKDVIISFFQTK